MNISLDKLAGDGWKTLTAGLPNNLGTKTKAPLGLAMDLLSATFFSSFMSKKKYKKSDDLLDDAAKSLKKFRKVTRQIGKLSTGQKIVGGLALLAAGLTYLAQQQAEDEPSKDDKPKPLALPAAADESPASSETEEAAASAASAGPARRKKNGKSH